ncbi:preprotein translocase [Paenibacillus popilliae]|uniref:preprotein translocase n=1 Tax=Paenibacillus popilliae TaxID=78057 RepID=UPI0011D1C754|nr:preprotein translocase [Paenibacillus popilliae]
MPYWEKRLVVEGRIHDLCPIFDIDLPLFQQTVPDDDWNEECFLVDKQQMMDTVYKDRMYHIDGCMGQPESKSDAVDSEMVTKLLSILFALGEHGIVRIESEFLYDANLLNFPEECVEPDILLGMKSLFEQEILEEVSDREIVKCLVVASLRNRMTTCFYLLDRKTIVWTTTAGYVVYIADQEQVNVVRTACAAQNLVLLANGCRSG